MKCILSKWEKGTSMSEGVHTLCFVCCRSCVKRCLHFNWSCCYPALDSGSWGRERGEGRGGREVQRAKLGKRLVQHHVIVKVWSLKTATCIYLRITHMNTLFGWYHIHLQERASSLPNQFTMYSVLDHPSTHTASIYCIHAPCAHKCMYVYYIQQRPQSTTLRATQEEWMVSKAIPRGVEEWC